MTNVRYWGINRLLKDPIGYLKAEAKQNIRLWTKINKLSTNWEEADLSCSVIEKYEKVLKELDGSHKNPGESK